MEIAAPKPQNIYLSKYIQAKLVFHPSLTKSLNASYGLYSPLQKFIDQNAMNGMTPYIPFKAGVLRRSMIINTVIGSGMIVLKTPYAKYQYFGKVMAGSPKEPIDKDLVYHGGPLTGPFWDKRWWADHGAEFTQFIQRRIDSGRR